MSDSKVAVVAGYGTGISAAVAKRFGAGGYKLALLARTQSRLDEAVAGFTKEGITAKGYTIDLSNLSAVRDTLAAVHKDLGPITLLHWNAAFHAETEFLSAPPEQFQQGFQVAVSGLVAAVQAAHEDLRSTKGTILITGDCLSLEDDTFTQIAADFNVVSLAVAKAAQRKLVPILQKSLATDGIYVAEVTVCERVKGTLADPEGTSTLTAEAVAERFWDVAEKRDPEVWFVKIS